MNGSTSFWNQTLNVFLRELERTPTQEQIYQIHLRRYEKGLLIGSNDDK